MAQVCLDANLVLSWLLPSQTTPAALLAQEELMDDDFDLVGPPLLYVEVTSVLRTQVHFKKLTPPEGDLAFEQFCNFEITSVNHHELHRRAWSLSNQLSMPKAYDAQYLALADLLDCELWTLDEKLINAVGRRFPRLRALQ
jgi:predicted nucleic acid-binding protein